MTQMWVLALILVIVACTETRQPETKHGDAPRFLSLPPESLGGSLSLSQLVTGEYGEKFYKMRFELDISPQRFVLVGLSPIGVTLFTIVHENGELEVNTLSGRERVIDPRYTLFDVYLAYWPTKELRIALSRMGLLLEETADGSVRRVRNEDDEMIAEISYSPGPSKTGEIMIQHFDYPYRLRVETLDVSYVR